MRRRAFLAAAGLGVMGAARAGEPPAAPEERAWPDVAITDTHVHFWDPPICATPGSMVPNCLTGRISPNTTPRRPVP